MSKPKRKQLKQRNHTVRVSEAVHELVEKRREPWMSWDVFFRLLLGLPTKKRSKSAPVIPRLREGFILPSAMFHSASEARGAAVVASVKSGKETEQPIRMREVI